MRLVQHLGSAAFGPLSPFSFRLLVKRPFGAAQGHSRKRHFSVGTPDTITGFANQRLGRATASMILLAQYSSAARSESARVQLATCA